MPELNWEQWQWRGTLHSPKLQHYWNLTIRLFSVTLGGGSYPSAEKQSLYSTAPTDWATHWGGSYPPAEKQSVYSTPPNDWATRWGGVIPLCREAVGVFYSSNRLGHSLGWGLAPLQRSSKCILQLQLTGHVHIDLKKDEASMERQVNTC